MLDSLQLRVSVSVLLLLLHISYLASAYEMSATPDHMTLRLEPNKKVCKELRLEADSKNIRVSTLWSPIKSTRLNDFTYTAQEQGIYTTHPTQLKNKGETIEVCVQVPDSYAYYGVILIEDEKVGAGLGVWLTINPQGQLKPIPPHAVEEKTQAPITGNTIKEKQNKTTSIEPYILAGSTMCTLLLSTVLVWLYRKNQRRDVC